MYFRNLSAGGYTKMLDTLTLGLSPDQADELLKYFDEITQGLSPEEKYIFKGVINLIYNDTYQQRLQWLKDYRDSHKFTPDIIQVLEDASDRNNVYERLEITLEYLDRYQNKIPIPTLGKISNILDLSFYPENEVLKLYVEYISLVRHEQLGKHREPINEALQFLLDSIVNYISKLKNRKKVDQLYKITPSIANVLNIFLNGQSDNWNILVQIAAILGDKGLLREYLDRIIDPTVIDTAYILMTSFKELIYTPQYKELTPFKYEYDECAKILEEHGAGYY